MEVGINLLNRIVIVINCIYLKKLGGMLILRFLRDLKCL